jgi:hypothetical protein
VASIPTSYALCALLVLSGAAPTARADSTGAADTEEPIPPEERHIVLGLDFFGGAPSSSHTRVREFEHRGDFLELDRDLGIPAIGEARLRLGYRFDPKSALTLSFSSLFLYGSARLDHDTTYNGTTFSGKTRLASRPLWLVAEIQYERTLFCWGDDDRGALSAGVGLRADFLHWILHGTVDSTSSKKEQGEAFVQQVTPIPFVGISLREPIARDFDLVGYGRGFRANHWNSLRTEGGIMWFSESFVEAGLGIAYHITRTLELYVGYRYLLVDIRERSREDTNAVTVSSHGGTIGLTLAF